MLKFCVLSSGSKGNAVYVEVDGHVILLDAGITFAQLNKRFDMIGRDIDSIERVFLTHVHSDHCRAVKMINSKIKFPPAIHQETDNTIKEAQIVNLTGYTDDGPFVTAFRLDHDVPCLGYSVTDNDGNKLLYITDTGTIPCDSLGFMMDYDAVILECNHDVELLNASPYNDELQQRVFETHLENFQAREFLEITKDPRLKYVVGHHLSNNSNNKKIAEYEIRAGLGAGYEKVTVLCADEKQPTPMMVLI